MKTKLLLCLFATFATVHAANYVGDQTFSAPFTLNEGVNIVGNLTLATPGTYSASNWNVVGLVRFGAPGDYTVNATVAGISFAGNVLGAPTGTVIVHVNYLTTINVVGTVAGNITVVDNAQPPVSPATVVNAPPPSPLMNVATRATLGAGGVLNPGFVIGGTISRRVLIRAVGPGLAQFGVSGVMANPTVVVYRGSLQLASNEGWGGDTNLSAVFAAVGAFGLTTASKDAAVVLTLAPGAYTLVVRGAGATDAGEVLAEVYLVE
jgi:hypothetical protein